MNCPNDGAVLKKLRLSLVCPNCSYKKIQPAKKIYPELNRTVLVPEGIAWSSFTLTNCSVSSGVVSLDSGQVSGTAVSPQLANITRNEDQDMWHDITKILFRRLTAAKNEGRVRIQASNDSGTTWTRVKDDNQEWRLNSGNEGDLGGSYQAQYDDLRIKFTLTRSNSSLTSPTITNITVEHNYAPESRKTKKRVNPNKYLLGTK